MRLALLLGARPNGYVSGSWPALIQAADSGQLNSVQFLLKRGADVNIHNQWGMTPLICAAENGHLEVARFLLDAGANPNIISEGIEPGGTALMAAKNHPDIIALLLSRGAKPMEPK